MWTCGGWGSNLLEIVGPLRDFWLEPLEAGKHGEESFHREEATCTLDPQELWSQSLCRRTLGSIEVRSSSILPNREVILRSNFWHIHHQIFAPMGHAQPRSTCFWLLPQKWCFLWQLCNGENDGKFSINHGISWIRGWGYFQTTPLDPHRSFSFPGNLRRIHKSSHILPLSHQFPAVCESPRWCVPPCSVWFWLRCSKKWVFPNQLVRCGDLPHWKTCLVNYGHRVNFRTWLRIKISA